MPHFFFHLRNHTDEILDPEGRELADLHAAKAIALLSARDTLSHEIRDGVIGLRYRIDVEDGEGAALHSLSLKDAFKVIEP